MQNLNVFSFRFCYLKDFIYLCSKAENFNLKQSVDIRKINIYKFKTITNEKKA